MSDFGMFGGPVGEMNFNVDQHTQAETERLQTETQQKQLEMQQTARLGEFMQQAAATNYQASGRAPSQAAPFEDLAKMAAGAGFVTKAEELTKAAVGIREKEAQTKHAETLTKKDSLETNLKDLEFTGRLMENVTDETSWNKANLLYQLQTGRPSVYAGLPYNANTVANIQATNRSVKDQVSQQIRQDEADSKEDLRTSVIDHQRAQESIAERKLALAQAREARLAKVGGGKPVGDPGDKAVKQAEARILQDFPEIGDSKKAAYQIAADAKARWKANPGLDSNVAIEQAFFAAKQRGDFQTTEEPKKLFGMDVSAVPIIGGKTKATKFAGGGATAETAIPAPADPKKMVTGKYYHSPSGQVARWTGKGMQLVNTQGFVDNETDVKSLLKDAEDEGDGGGDDPSEWSGGGSGSGGGGGGVTRSDEDTANPGVAAENTQFLKNLGVGGKAAAMAAQAIRDRGYQLYLSEMRNESKEPVEYVDYKKGKR